MRGGGEYWRCLDKALEFLQWTLDKRSSLADKQNFWQKQVATDDDVVKALHSREQFKRLEERYGGRRP